MCSSTNSLKDDKTFLDLEEIVEGRESIENSVLRNHSQGTKYVAQIFNLTEIDDVLVARLMAKIGIVKKICHPGLANYKKSIIKDQNLVIILQRSSCSLATAM